MPNCRAATAPWDTRLASAEKNLAGLEELLPLEANLQATRQRVVTTQRRVEQLEVAVKESRARWRNALRQLNLPEDYVSAGREAVGRGHAAGRSARDTSWTTAARSLPRANAN